MTSQREEERGVLSQPQGGQSRTDLAGSQQDLHERVRVFLEVSAALVSSVSLESTLSTIIQLAERVLTADAFAIWRIEDATVRLVSSHGLSDEYLQNLELQVPDRFALLTDMVVPDAQGDPDLAHLRDRYMAEGIRSLLVMTLAEGPRVFGTLTLYYKTPHTFDDSEVMVARTLANLSSAAIGAAALAEAEARESLALATALEAARRAESRLRLINEAGAIFNESLDYNLTLNNLTKAIVPELADWCTVHLLEGEVLKQVALAHVDPEKQRQALENQSGYEPNPDAPNGIYRVVRTGESVIMNEVLPEALTQGAPNAQNLRLVEGGSTESYACVPLRTRTRVIGTLTLIRAHPNHPYDDADLQVIEELGRRAGLAVEKAILYEESESSRASLQRANEAKDEFLGMVSHELRTPISTVYGSAQLLLSKWNLVGEEDRQELLTNVKNEATRMIGLVETLLLLARLELTQTATKTSVDVPELLDKTLSSPEGQARDLSLDYRAHLRHIETSPTALEQVLNNLIDNALKYSPAGTPIDVVVDEEPGALIFRVLDRGPGVDAADLDLIFESFHRARRTAHLPGKGLGLSICRRIVEALGGKIWARPRPGGGLEVAFSLPIETTA